MSTAPAPVTAPATGSCDVLAAKVQKHVDGLHAKIAKLQAENAALKSSLAAARSSNSRIRRIPKKGTEAVAAQ